VGCTAQNPEQSHGPGEPVSARQQGLLPFDCAGTLTRLPERHYANLDLDITPYFCLTHDRPALHEMDSTGRQWSPDELRIADAAAFRDRYHRLASDLRARIARDAESVRQLADVWFPTPLAADQKLPPKPQFLALSRTEQKAIIDEHNAAVAARARKIASMIQSLAPGATMDADSFAFKGEGPLLQIEAAPADLRAIGDQNGIQYVGLSLRADEDQPASSAWFNAGQFNVLQYLGEDGDGVSVADVLGGPGVYDTRKLDPASGSCDAPYGPDYDCYCAASSPGQTHATHMQWVMSVIKNTWGASLPSGAARHARTLADNSGDGACGSVVHLEQFIPWAVNHGATVINRSATNSVNMSRYLDCVAAGPYYCAGAPVAYPSIVAAAGNYGYDILSHLDNGLVVGGADDHDGTRDRTTMGMYVDSSWHNIDDEELPHLVAPAVHIDFVTDDASGNPALGTKDGTSFSAPQVSGAIASLQETNTALTYWPEAVIPIMLVSAFDEANPDGPDGTASALGDNIDDKDGAGLLAAGEAWEVVYAGQKSVGNTPADRGFDFGYHDSTDWPQYNWTNAYFASVPPGAYLRVATVLLNHPVCGSPADQGNCTADTFPSYFLHVYNTGTGQYWFSVGSGNNYKYLLIHNTYSTTQTFGINMYMADWNQMTQDTFGVAWDSREL